MMIQRGLSGKRLLILGSNVYKDLIEEAAREMGLEIIFAGLYPGVLDDIADEVYRIDTTDPGVMIPFIKTHNIDGIYLGASELIISSACGYVNQLGYPCYYTESQWKLLQNKSEFKKLCAKYDLPVVKEYAYKELDEDCFPVIVKPVDGCGSKGLALVNNNQQLQSAYMAACKVSSSGKAIIEKKVKNDAIYQYYNIFDGKLVSMLSEDTYGVSDPSGSFTKSLYLAPSRRERAFRDKFEDKISQMLAGIGIKNGEIWFEVFVDSGRYFFNECGLRPAGHFSMLPVYYYSHINQLSSYFYYALTGKSLPMTYPKLLNLDNQSSNYGVLPIHCYKGTIGKIDYSNLLEENQQIVKVSFQKNVGDTIVDDKDFSSIVCFVHFKYNDSNDCMRIIQIIHSTLSINDINNNNMINTAFNMVEEKSF